MPDVIDTLQVEINGKADNANKAIDNLVIKLDRLTTSISGINKANFTGFSVGVKNVSSAMQGLSNVKLPDYTRLAKGIEKFSTINAGQIQSAGMAMQELGKSLRMIDGINMGDNAVQLASLAKGISQLGYKSATQAVANIPKLATAMRDLMTTLSSAPRVSQNLIDMTNALASLARTGASSGRASTSLAKSLDVYTASTRRASKGTWSLASAFGKIYASYWLLFRAFSKIGDAIDISSDLTEIQNVVDVTFGDMTHKVEEFAETSIEQFGMSELTLKQVASQFQAMGSAMNIGNGSIASANKYLNEQTDGYVELGNSMADVSLTLTKLTADMASFYNVEQDVVSEDLQSIFTGSTKPLRQYGIDLTEINLKQWAMTQGLNSNIDAMTQAEKVMLRYQYVLAHTGASQNDFSRTMSTWSNQVRILKQNFQQLGAIIGGTFINMLKPLVQALNSVMSSVISFAQTISNALGKIFGWQYEVGNGGVASDLESGADYADDLSDSMGSASDNAKKLKSYLLGIDELNVLEPQTDSDSGSGSGSGSGASGGASGGQWVKTDGLFADYESEIDSLFELGRYISDTLSEVMEGIDWESVYEKARGFGTGLADFLNGLITPRLFGNVGKTIANSLNTALEFLNLFGETFDFYNFGVSIATGINEFFNNFDFELLATTLNTWVDGLKETIKGFVDTITWESIIGGATDFFGTLELDTVAVLIGGFYLKNTAKNLRELLATAIASKWAFATNPLNLKELVVAFGKISIQTNPTMLADLSMRLDHMLEGTIFDPYSWDNWIGEALRSISALTNGFADALIKILKDTFNWDDSIALLSDAKNKIKEAFSADWNEGEGIFGNDIGKNILLGIIEGFTGAIGLIFEPIANFFEGFVESICETFGINSPAKNMKPYGEYIFLGILEGFESMFDSFTESLAVFWTDYVSPWFTTEKWSELYSTIKTELENKWNEVVEWWTTSGIYRWYNDNVKPWFSKENWTFSGIKDGLKQAWENAIEAVKAVWNKFANWFNSKMTIELPKIEIGGETIFDGKDITFIQLPTFQTGGFPEDGLFMANHTELVGRFSNGRTAVANNEMITTGIENAVYRGFSMAYSENNREATLLEELIVAVREGKSITIDGRELVEAYDNRKARNGFAF